MVNPGKKLKKILLISGITGAVYMGFKYLLPLMVPFLFAYAAALWLRPSVRFFERKLQFQIRGKQHHVPAAVIGGAELVLISLIFFGVLYLGSSRLLDQVYAFSTAFPRWLTWLDGKLTGFCRSAEQALGLKNDYLVILVRDMVAELGSVVRTSTMPAIMNNSMAIVSKLMGMLVFLVIFYVGTLMFLQEMESIRERKSRSMFHREFFMVGQRLVSVCNAWVKTQFVIMAVTSVLCILGLFLIGNSYSLLLGIGIGILDALPIFGTGTVLIPWGIVLLLQKKWKEGLVILALYAVCYFVREILEARIMGNKVGLSALETLISMYVGLKLFGIAGFFLGPVGLLLVEDLVELYWENESA